LLVDDLISIPPNTWTSLLHGLKRYVADPRAQGTGVGVGFLGVACIADLYSTPSVEIAMLPGNATAIGNAVDGALPINLSPLQAAIEGALTYTRSFSNTHPERKLALVLITDSIADAVACGDASSLSSATRDGVTGTPSIATYVLAIVDPNTLSLALSLPSLLQNPALLASSPLGPLSQIAAAGGTAQAFPYSPLAEPSDNAEPSPFADTMLKVQHEAEPCDYAVPDAVPDDGAGAWLMIDGRATADPLPARATEAECGTGYSLATTADGKRWARLCSATCADVKGAKATLSWVSGCP
jgi:hypothetical protein